MLARVEASIAEIETRDARGRAHCEALLMALHRRRAELALEARKQPSRYPSDRWNDRPTLAPAAGFAELDRKKRRQ